MNATETRQCNVCQTIKPLTDYAIHRGKRRLRCKACIARSNRTTYAKQVAVNDSSVATTRSTAIRGLADLLTKDAVVLGLMTPNDLHAELNRRITYLLDSEPFSEGYRARPRDVQSKHKRSEVVEPVDEPAEQDVDEPVMDREPAIRDEVAAKSPPVEFDFDEPAPSAAVEAPSPLVSLDVDEPVQRDTVSPPTETAAIELDVPSQPDQPATRAVNEPAPEVAAPEPIDPATAEISEALTQLAIKTDPKAAGKGYITLSSGKARCLKCGHQSVNERGHAVHSRAKHR